MKRSIEKALVDPVLENRSLAVLVRPDRSDPKTIDILRGEVLSRNCYRRTLAFYRMCRLKTLTAADIVHEPFDYYQGLAYAPGIPLNVREKHL
jgi:hypothetical protein